MFSKRETGRMQAGCAEVETIIYDFGVHIEKYATIRFCIAAVACSLSFLSSSL